MPADADDSRRALHRETSPNVARIKVIGVGGGGNNAVNRMIAAGIAGVEFISINTDVQALQASKAPIRLQLGALLTRGRGTGGVADIGRQAAIEDSDKILDVLEDADMVFLTAGLGGGSGTGGAPVIASLARGVGALTVAVVTRPFRFEGKQRMLQAERGLEELLNAVDTLIVISNEKLLTAAKDAGFFESFRIADDVLRHAVQSITNIITVPGIINRDFADLRNIMAGMGHAVMGTASCAGPNRAVEAALAAVASPLLEPEAISGARAILINISGSSSLKLKEVNEASTIIQAAGHEDANIIFGAVLDDSLGEEIKITVIATDFHGRPARREPLPAAIDASTDSLSTATIDMEETLVAESVSTTQQAEAVKDGSSDIRFEELHPSQRSPVLEEPIYEAFKYDESTSDVSPDELSTPLLSDDPPTADQEESQRHAAAANVSPHPLSFESALSSMQRAAVAGYAALSANPSEVPGVAAPVGFAEILHHRMNSVEEEASYVVDPYSVAAETTNDLPAREAHTEDSSEALELENILQRLQKKSEAEMEPLFTVDEFEDEDFQNQEKSLSGDELVESLPDRANDPSEVHLAPDLWDSPVFRTSSNEGSTSSDFEKKMHEDDPGELPEINDVAYVKRRVMETWNSPEAPARIAPFAGIASAYEETGEMDELDIPAFLRQF